MFKKRNYSKILILCMVLMLVFSSVTLAEDLINSETKAENGIVSSAHPLASKAGLKILKNGGNVVDAAVATAFAVGVVEPNGSGIGGEGVMLIRLDDGTEVAIDYRSCAPKAVHKYNDEEYGPKSVAIPGTVAGLTKALNEYGTMELEEVMDPAIKYAEEGFKITDNLGREIMNAYEKLRSDPAASEIFLEDGFPKMSGSVLKQSNLANTLKTISKKGANAFYEGEIAEKIALEMKKSGGIITKEDLSKYEAVIREPVKGSYRGYDIIAAPPPVSGMVVIEALHILENFDLSKMGYMSADALHVLAESIRLAYRDRYTYMADPDFVDVPTDILLNKAYATQRSKVIDMDKQISYSDLKGGLESTVTEAPSTTHFVVADKEGNMVSVTQTLSSFFGSSYVVPDTGILLNNEMKNFSSSGINRMEPYKTMRTTIAPTIMTKDDKPFLTIGSPGASRISPAIVNTIVNLIDYDMSLQEAIEAPRFATKLVEDLYLEDRLPANLVNMMKRKKYEHIYIKGKMDLYFGGVQAAMYDNEYNVIIGGADPRRDSAAFGF